MEALLLLIVIALLWVDLDEEDICPDCRSERRDGLPEPARPADLQLRRLTDQAVLAMLDEARRYEPGRRS